MIERLRPEGFSITEGELRQIKTLRVSEILEGRHLLTYSEWLLRGSPGEPFSPTAVLAFFPVPAATKEKFVYEGDAFIEHDTQEIRDTYWREAAKLSLPRRVVELETKQYQRLAEKGDVMVNQLRSSLMRWLFPSAMVAFSESSKSKQESAYLICPTLIPPTAAFRHFISHARSELYFE